MSLIIRKATEQDSPALSRICLSTADAGETAEPLHKYGELPGLIWSVPYVKLLTTWAFVLVDEAIKDEIGEGLVVGYVIGTSDTIAFEQYAAEHWWPVQAAKYPLSLISGARSGDERCIKLLHNMYTAGAANLEFASAHMHINILKDYRGKQWGRKLVGRAVEYLKELGVRGDGVWLGIDSRNDNARKFYERIGFKPIPGADDCQFGLRFADWKM